MESVMKAAVEECPSGEASHTLARLISYTYLTSYNSRQGRLLLLSKVHIGSRGD
jgi:hypothetical protein